MQAENAKRAAEEAAEARIAAAVAAAQREAEARVATERAKMQQDLVFERASFNHPNLKHGSVRKLFRDGYGEYRSGAGDQALPFEQWIVSDATRADPVYGAHLVAPTAASGASPLEAPPPTSQVAPPAAPAPQRIPPNPNVGAEPSPTPGVGRYSDIDIQRCAQDPKLWAIHGDRIRAQQGLPPAKKPAGASN